MAHGLQIWDATGNLILDTSTYTSKAGIYYFASITAAGRYYAPAGIDFTGCGVLIDDNANDPNVDGDPYVTVGPNYIDVSTAPAPFNIAVTVVPLS